LRRSATYDLGMLLRLGIKGFKSLREADIRFGPLTCFVGLNGVGKSNIFDAIQFLRFLADDEFQVAAEKVRGTAVGRYSPLELFWAEDPCGRIELEADMIAPVQSMDDFGQPVRPTINLLRYKVCFRYQNDPAPRLLLEHESLSPLKKGDAKGLIGFKHSGGFRASAVIGKRFGGPFISTETLSGSESATIKLHGDGGSRGRPVPASHSPRTVLGGTGSLEYPTVVAARREMASWRAIHLEPTSLRSPDGFGDTAGVDEHGRHIASTLHLLEKREKNPGATLQEACNRLSELVPEVKKLRIDRDEMREQLVVKAMMQGSDIWLAPRSLSDGLLRFLALVTMQMDPDSCRVLCMEEPENGIHPSRIREVVGLLRDYVVNPEEDADEENPIRQVILNTHSPEVVRQLDVPDLLFVESAIRCDGREAVVRPIRAQGNWRGNDDALELDALERLIGGGPISAELEERQMNFKFGACE
jgi:predicted ATPase